MNNKNILFIVLLLVTTQIKTEVVTPDYIKNERIKARQNALKSMKIAIEQKIRNIAERLENMKNKVNQLRSEKVEAGILSDLEKLKKELLLQRIVWVTWLSDMKVNQSQFYKNIPKVLPEEAVFSKIKELSAKKAMLAKNEKNKNEILEIEKIIKGLNDKLEIIKLSREQEILLDKANRSKDEKEIKKLLEEQSKREKEVRELKEDIKNSGVSLQVWDVGEELYYI